MKKLFTKFTIATVITGLVLFMLWLVFLSVTGSSAPLEIVKIAAFSAFVTAFLGIKS